MTKKALTILATTTLVLPKPPGCGTAELSGPCEPVERVTCRPRRVPLGLSRLVSGLYEENADPCASKTAGLLRLLR